MAKWYLRFHAKTLLFHSHRIFLLLWSTWSENITITNYVITPQTCRLLCSYLEQYLYKSKSIYFTKCCKIFIFQGSFQTLSHITVTGIFIQTYISSLCTSQDLKNSVRRAACTLDRQDTCFELQKRWCSARGARGVELEQEHVAATSTNPLVVRRSQPSLRLPAFPRARCPWLPHNF